MPAATWARSWRRRSWPRMSFTASTPPAPLPKRPTNLAVEPPGRSCRRSPPPASPAALLMFFGILAVSDPTHPELGKISGGLPFLVKDVLGPELGAFLLIAVIFAVFVCALAVHAASVRLMFAMARDNNLPFAHSLAHVQAWSKAPIVPSIVVGVLAAAILVVNINLPNVIETLCSVAIVWANLAYLLVTMPLLAARLRRGARHTFGGTRGDSNPGVATAAEHDRLASPYFSLGRWGLPVNAIAVVWGLFVVINIGWPRPEVYGAERWGRFAAPLATLGLIVAGALYFLLFQRKRTGILAEHAAEDILESRSVATDDPPIECRWIGQLAPGEWGARLR